jgi:N-acetylmuramoyl-L-alanine amidase
MNFPSPAARACSFFLAPWLMSAVLKADEAFKWTPVEIGGRDYLSTVEIGRFYNLKLLAREGRQVVFDTPKILMKMEVGSSECTMNGTRFIFETPVVESDAVAFVSRTDLSRVIDPVLRPNMIKHGLDFRTVILDPADGGADRGVTGESGSAADDSLKVAKLAAKLFEARGFKVVLTRDEDVALPPAKRLELANAVKASAVFVRIEFSADEGGERGLRTAPLASHAVAPADEAVVVEDFGHASMALATAIHGSVLRRLGDPKRDRGIKPEHDSELSRIAHPSVVIHAGNPVHSEDAKLIHDERYQDALSKAIVQGVVKYRNAVSRKP